MRAPYLTDLLADSDKQTIFFDPFDLLSDHKIYVTEYDGKAIYLDNNHYSMVGSKLIQLSLFSSKPARF